MVSATTSLNENQFIRKGFVIKQNPFVNLQLFTNYLWLTERRAADNTAFGNMVAEESPMSIWFAIGFLFRLDKHS
jgi:hypothetical protein